MATALTASRATPRLLSCYDMEHEYPVNSGSTIYNGAWVGLDVDGLLVPAGAASLILLGRARTPNGLPLLGTNTNLCKVDQGIFRWTVEGSAPTRADVGQIIYATSDQEANLTGTNIGGIIYDLRRSEDPAGSIWVLTYLGMSLGGT